MVFNSFEHIVALHADDEASLPASVDYYSGIFSGVCLYLSHSVDQAIIVGGVARDVLPIQPCQAAQLPEGAAARGSRGETCIVTRSLLGSQETAGQPLG